MQPDEEQRWLRVLRGDAELAMNFASDREARVPVSGTTVVLATHEASIGSGAVTLPPLAGALIR